MFFNYVYIFLQGRFAVKPHKVFKASKPCELAFGKIAAVLFDFVHCLIKGHFPINIRQKFAISNAFARLHFGGQAFGLQRLHFFKKPIFKHNINTGVYAGIKFFAALNIQGKQFEIKRKFALIWQYFQR